MRGTSLVTTLALLALAGLTSCSAAAGTGTPSRQSLYTTIKKTGVLKVGIRTDDPPHSYLNSKGQLVGFDVDIANAIAREWHVKLDVVPVSELTRISYIQDGKIDLAITSISQTVQRWQAVDFSQTYFWSYQTFLVRKGKIANLSQLAGKTVGADLGSNAAGQWQAWLKAHGYPDKPKVELFSDKEAAVHAVATGAIAGYAEDYEILASFAKTNPGLAVLNSPGGIGVKLDGIAMHKSDSQLLLQTDLALQALSKSGEYMRIYNKWFGPTSATPVPLQGHIEVWPYD
jgi:polar amino acid transport system substrate-binding protein